VTVPTRYSLRHVTAYRYATPVDLAAHMLYLTPRCVPGQAVESVVLDVFPLPTYRAEGTDNFGNGVSWLSVEATEFALPSPLVPAETGAGAYAAQSFTPRRPVLAGLLELTARIKRDFTFRPGVTTISTPVTQVLATGPASARTSRI